jgi:hypothetical protein
MACFSASYMACMLFMVPSVLMYVENLQYTNCRHRLPIYVVSSISPREFRLYPTALMMSGFKRYDCLCSGSRHVRISVECCVVILSFYVPSWVDSRAYKVWSSRGVVTYFCVYILKSLMSFVLRSMLTIRYRPPLSCSSWVSLNVLLCLDVRSLELYLHPPKRCVFVSGWLYLPYSIGPCELHFFLYP